MDKKLKPVIEENIKLKLQVGKLGREDRVSGRTRKLTTLLYMS